MNATRLWTLGSVIVIIALLLGTWFVGISPRLAEAATANSDRGNVETLNARHTVTLTSLKKQFEGIDALKADLDELRIAVPASAETADFLRQLHSLARSSDTTITEISVASPVLFAAPEVPPVDPELASALGSVNPENFMAIQVEITATGDHADIMGFLSSLQTGDRAFLVHDLDLESGLPSGGTSVEATFTGQVFVLLDGPSGATGESPAEGGAVPTEGVPIQE